MADDLLAPQAITLEMIADVARASLRQGGDRQPVRDFLLRVDWSRMGEPSDLRVTQLLTSLDGWLHLPVERQLSHSQFVNRLLDIIPADEATALRNSGTLGLSQRRGTSEVRPRSRQPQA